MFHVKHEKYQLHTILFMLNKFTHFLLESLTSYKKNIKKEIYLIFITIYLLKKLPSYKT